jgi:hypothetical protein
MQLPEAFWQRPQPLEEVTQQVVDQEEEIRIMVERDNTPAATIRRELTP